MGDDSNVAWHGGGYLCDHGVVTWCSHHSHSPLRRRGRACRPKDRTARIDVEVWAVSRGP